MSWWRYESTLSPAQRYAQRLLRSREAALRTRCFSRSPYNLTQHEDHDGKQRPPHLSKLEWMQLQHYKRWRKRLSEDPYHAIFGASNDMLSGKGLKDWEWVHKSFPRWLVGELDKSEETKRVHEKANLKEHSMPEHPYPETEADRQTKPRSSNTQSARYPKRVEIWDDKRQVPQEWESHFAQPSFKSARLDGDDAGVSSPSDPRRPREHHHINPVVNNLGSSPVRRSEAQSATSRSESPMHTPHSTRNPRKNFEAPGDIAPKPDPSRQTQKESSAHEASARESSFINEFLTGEPHHSKAENSHLQSKATWKQAASQGRSSSGALDSSQLIEFEAIADDVRKMLPKSPPNDSSGEPLSQNTDHNGIHHNKSTVDIDWLIEQDLSAQKSQISSESDATPSPYISKASAQSTSSDIDSLSAADIRATMGRKHKKSVASEGESLERNRLEHLFEEMHSNRWIDDSTSDEKRLINEQRLRRLDGEKRRAQLERENQETLSKNENSRSTLVEESPIESSIDRMRKWLEQSSAMLSSHFWQDPSEATDVQKAKIILDKAVTRLHKGRSALKQVMDDLGTDLPASRPLLKRLKENEEMVDSTFQTLRQHLNNSAQLTPPPKTSRSKLGFHTNLTAAELELGAAYTVLGELRPTDTAKSASPSFKRRLRIASKIARQNVNLTGHLYWNLRTRSEELEAGETFFTVFGPVSHSLFILRDTQSAISNLVDRAMLVYEVDPTLAADFSWLSGRNDAEISREYQAEHPTHAAVENDSISVKAESVEAKSSASLPKESLEKRSPLVHSLFRPFSPILESLGKEDSEDIDQTEKSREMKASQEARKFERQSMVTKSFEMLKDDPDSRSLPSSTLNSVRSTETLEGHASMVSGTPEAETLDKMIKGTSSSSMSDHSSTAHLPTHYTILIHDPNTDNLSLTTSTTGPPRDTSPVIPIHQALSILSRPSKFVPHINEGLEVVSAKNNMLILRNALNDASSTRAFETIDSSSSSSLLEDSDASRREVNPIDGTVRLSPTGYVGPEENQEQLEKEFQERRQAAGQMNTMETIQRMREEQRGKNSARKEKLRRRGGVGAVIRTAIWASAFCYVVGVAAEMSIH